VDVLMRDVMAALAAAVVLTGCGGGDDAGSAVVVTGQVLSAPSCPVERVGQPCPPRPVPDAVVTALVGDEQRGETTSDERGQFRLTLPAGRYIIRATNPGGYASTASEEVTVSTVPVQITLTVDSGIR
jgi:hypothetical protein